MKVLENQIKTHYAEKYASSPVNVSDEEISLLINRELQCGRCSVSIFETYDFPEIRDESVYCEDCYNDIFRVICPICQESFENSETVETYRFIITPELCEEARIKTVPGIYQALEFPIYLANCVTGFDFFFEHAIKLLAPINEDSPLSQKEFESSGEICDECFQKYVSSIKT